MAPGAQGARVPAQRALAAVSTGAWARNAPGELGLPARSSLNLAFPRCSAVLRAPRHSGPFCLCASVPVLSALRPSWGHPLVFPESAWTRPQQASQLGHFSLSVTRGFLVPPVLTARTTCDLFLRHPPSLAAPRILISSEWRPQSSDRERRSAPRGQVNTRQSWLRPWRRQRTSAVGTRRGGEPGTDPADPAQSRALCRA